MKRVIFLIWILPCLLAPASLVLSAEPLLRILPSQKHIPTPTGKDYGIMCEGVADEVEGMFNDMRWIDPNGDQVQEGTPGVRQYDSNQLKLTFIKPTADQTGQYNCTAVYSNTVTLHASVYITFYEDIQFDDCLEQQDLIVGLPGDIRCHVTASPPPKVRWEKDKMTIKSDRYSFSQDGIHITNVTEVDKGLYMVEAFVSASGNYKFRSIAVNVLIPEGKNDAIGSIHVLEVTDSSVLFNIGISKPTSENQDILVQYQERFDRYATLVLWKSAGAREIRNLNASGLYNFRFQVQPNGDWSDLTKVVLLPAVPEMILYSFTGGSVVLNLYQTTNDYVRNTIDKYLLSYNQIQEVELKGWVQNECQVTVEVPKCKFPRYTIADLALNNYYEVRVQTHTVAGYGKPYIQKLHVT